MLNRRKERLLIILNEATNWMTGKELARILNVSDRTIRSDIESINSEYGVGLIESSIRSGYRMESELFAKLKIDVQSSIPQTPNERCNYIMQELLFVKNDVNLIELQDRVFVSGYSIDNDIKKIKSIVEAYGDLELVRSNNHISLKGSERNKRRLFKDLLEKETKGNFLNMNNLASLYKDFDLLLVKRILEETFDEYGFHIRDVDIPMLMIHIGVSIERILKFNYISTDVDKEEISRTKEYRLAFTFFKRLSENIPIDVVEDEVYLLSILLLGKKGIDYRSDYVSKEIIGMRIDELIDILLERVKQQFGIDFVQDSQLRIGLQIHIQSLLERRVRKVKVTNVYLHEIKKRYPLVFEIGLQMGVGIEEVLGIDIDENEIGFLSLHIGSSYERLNTNVRYRAVLIFPTNLALSSMFIEKIQMHFEDRMEIVYVSQMFEESMIKNVNPDVILTTLPLQHALDVLTVQISIFVSSEDESKIFQALNALDKQYLQVEFNERIKDLMIKDYFFMDLEAKNHKEVIEYMCENLQKDGYIPEGFKDSVLKREELSATSFTYSFAIPHSFDVAANKSVISVAVLKNPIDWGQYPVKLVLLLAIEEKDMKIMRLFFDWLSSVVNDSNRLLKLLEKKSYEEFMASMLG